MQTKEHQAMVKARMELVLAHPFFGRLALRLEMVEDVTLAMPTMATDGETILYHPDFVNSVSKKELQGVIAHEVLHAAFSHPSQLQGLNIQKAKAAMDYAINPIILDAGLTLPDGGLVDKKYSGMTWQEIYKLLPDKPPQNFDDIVQKSRTPQQVEDWKMAVEAAAQIAHSQGKCPESLRKQVEASSRAKVVRWEDELWNYLEPSRGQGDYTYAEPNRQSAVTGTVMPALYSKETGHFAVIMDTSGSCSEAWPRFKQEITAVFESLRPRKLSFCCADAAVACEQEFEQFDDLSMQFAGGGGTSFVPAIQWAVALPDIPKLIIYFTDLEGEFPPEPNIPVLWVATTDHPIPYGDVIRIKV